MSDEAYLCLQKYLTKHGHISIIQIINIHITIIKKAADINTTDEESEKNSKNDIGINGFMEQVSGTGVDREMRELQEAISLMSSNACQTLRIFTVNNASENASCAQITPSMDKLVAGFSTAEIRLWGIGDTVLINPKARTFPINLACDLPSTSRPPEDRGSWGDYPARSH